PRGRTRRCARTPEPRPPTAGQPFLGGGPGMAARANPQYPSARTLRQFGWILAAGLALLGHVLTPSRAALMLQLAGAAVFAMSTVRPRSLQSPYLALLWAARPLIRLTSWFAKASQERPPSGPTRRQPA